MSGSRISRGGRPIPGAINAEFTPGQIVIGICVLIFVVMVSFGAGVLVGRGEPHQAQVIDTTVPPSQPAITQEPAQAKAATPPPPPRDATPPVETKAAETKTTDSKPGPPPLPGASVAKKQDSPSGPRTVDLPPLASGKSSNKTVEVPVNMPPPVVETDLPATADPKKSGTAEVSSLPPLPGKSDAATPGAKAPEAPKPNPELESALEEGLLEPIAPQPAKSDTTKSDASAKSAASTKPAANNKSGAAPAAKGGGYGIQVGSFARPNREEQANSLARTVEASGLKAEVRATADKSMYRVLVVGYPDRASAVKALNDLKVRPGFEKAFIQDLSKL